MKLITNVEGITLRALVGAVVDMVAANAPLDAAVEMQRNRNSDVTQISVDTVAPSPSEPETHEDAAAALQTTLEGGTPAAPPPQ